MTAITDRHLDVLTTLLSCPTGALVITIPNQHSAVENQDPHKSLQVTQVLMEEWGLAAYDSNTDMIRRFASAG